MGFHTYAQRTRSRQMVFIRLNMISHTFGTAHGYVGRSMAVNFAFRWDPLKPRARGKAAYSEPAKGKRQKAKGDRGRKRHDGLRMATQGDRAHVRVDIRRVR